MLPTKPSVESLTLTEFILKVEFSVAIGEEAIPLLRAQSRISASVKDWSAKVQHCCS